MPQGGDKRRSDAVARRVVSMVRQAVESHRAGRLDEAETGYRQAMQLQAGQPDALHFLGVLCHQRGRSDEGIRLVRMALRAVPHHAEAHNNLGNIHKESGHLAEAEACYRQALACVPDHLDALSNLAIVLEAQQRPQEALGVYQRLVERAPHLGRAHYLMGLFRRAHLQTLGDLEHAVACFRNACRCDVSDVRALKELGISLYMLDRREEAIDVYRSWLVREPDNPIPRHMLASCGGEVAPARADDAYVRQVFDSFADSFDEQLLHSLDYRAPQVLIASMAALLAPPEGALDVLDAGCGTGLCGPLIRPYARHLHGVDLSGKMVDKARARGGYDALDVAELTAFLRDRPARWDVVLSADTLVYFGDLREVLAAAHAALRSGGMLAFTLEALDSDEDLAELSPSGRYQHSQRHVQRGLREAGFADVMIVSESLRKEMGHAVAGWVVLARRAA